jgi:hypothetical protein
VADHVARSEDVLLTNLDVVDLREKPREEDSDDARNGTVLAACTDARNCIVASKTIQHWLLPCDLDEVDDGMLCFLGIPKNDRMVVEV